MSEVLITLVIIGIIAAITIPAISRSSEKYILRNQFKKAYSTIVNAMNKADRDLGGNTLCYYDSAGAAGNTRSDCPAFFEQMFSNLSVQKICSGNAKADGCIPTPYMKTYMTSSGMEGFSQNRIENTNHVYNLADGAIIIRYAYNLPLFLVDINGAKGPNERGKDIFVFSVSGGDNSGLRIKNNISDSEVTKPYFGTLNDIFKE